jgi:hypothetical protein
MAIRAQRCKVIVVIVGRVLVDVMDDDERRLADAASVVAPGYDGQASLFRQRNANFGHIFYKRGMSSGAHRGWKGSTRQMIREM